MSWFFWWIGVNPEESIEEVYLGPSMSRLSDSGGPTTGFSLERQGETEIKSSFLSPSLVSSTLIGSSRPLTTLAGRSTY